MITAIVNKSKPINLVFTSLMVVFSFLLVYLQTDQTTTAFVFFQNLLLVFVAIFSVLLTDFIVKKNKITGQNSFVAFFFAMFFFLFWGSNQDFRLAFSNVFILMALRKIISLKSQVDTTKKLFDASLWLCVATLFHFWAILYFIVLYLGIVIYAQNNYKNWLVPLVSIFSVSMILNAYELLFNGSFFTFSNTLMVLDFSKFDLFYNWFAVVFFVVILLVSLVFLPSRINAMLQANKLSYFILISALLVAIAIFIVSADKTRSLFIFMYFPLAVLFATFFEKLKKKTLQSVVIYLMLIISILFCAFSVV